MRSLTILCALLGSAMLSLAHADQKTDFGDYTVHYNAYPSTILSADVAKQYDLTRSKAIGYVSVSVLPSNEPSAKPRGLEADIDGEVLNDIRQSKALEFKRIKEGQALYYLAPFQFQPGQMLVFKLEIRPTGQESTFPLRFSQEFFND
ncbi:DUF4426 domain-containing protein [Marinobacteraceae bacterium S3BR75-40.1]